MTPTKDEIKNWLKEMDRDRFWLAKKCNVSKRTVDDWISTSREIPAKALLQIQELMEKDDEVPVSNQRNYTVKNGLIAVAVMMTEAEHSFIASMALLEDKTVDEFIKDAGLEDAERRHKSLIDQIPELQSDTPPSPSGKNTPTLIHGLDSGAEETSA